MAALERLFSPIKVGKMEVKNRIAMAPMTTNWAPSDGTVPDRMLEYLEARAQGGEGLIIFETVTVDERFPYIMNSVGLWDDALIPGFKRASWEWISIWALKPRSPPRPYMGWANVAISRTRPANVVSG